VNFDKGFVIRIARGWNSTLSFSMSTIHQYASNTVLAPMLTQSHSSPSLFPTIYWTHIQLHAEGYLPASIIFGFQWKAHHLQNRFLGFNLMFSCIKGVYTHTHTHTHIYKSESAVGKV
jgi:hypothetical protein